MRVHGVEGKSLNLIRALLIVNSTEMVRGSWSRLAEIKVSEDLRYSRVSCHII
jgi:hypothetical protein